MKEAFWGYLLVGLGLFIIVIMLLIENLTSTSEEDYYLTKEAMEAAMIDSIDYAAYALNGDIRIIESKFVENFTRRFAESVNGNKTYKLEFYEIYEYPPKATVRVTTSTGKYSVTTDSATDINIYTTLSGILATKYSDIERTVGVTLNVNGGYSYNANSTMRYSAYDGSLTYEIKPNAGYTVENMTATCTDGTVPVVEGSTVTINNITNAKSCYVNLQRVANFVTLTVNNGNLRSPATVGVAQGGTATYTIEPKAGYTLAGITSGRCTNGATYTVNNGTISVTGASSYQEACVITLKEQNNKVTVQVADSKGTLEGASSKTIYLNYEDSKSFTVVTNKYWSMQDAYVTCNEAVGKLNGNTLTVSHALNNSSCTVYIVTPTFLDDYWYIHYSGNNLISEHYSKYSQSGSTWNISDTPTLKDSKVISGSFSLPYSRTYSIELHGGGGFGGSGSYSNGSCASWFFSCTGYYSDTYAYGGGGGASGNRWDNIKLSATSYSVSVGKAASGQYDSNYLNQTYGGSTAFGSYTISGGQSGANGYTNDRGGSSWGYSGLSYGNLTVNDSATCSSWRGCSYSYSQTGASGGSSIGSHGNGGEGGNYWGNGTIGTDGAIILRITGS